MEEDPEFDMGGSWRERKPSGVSGWFGQGEREEEEDVGEEEVGEELVSLVRQREDRETEEHTAAASEGGRGGRAGLGLVMGVYIPCLLSIFGVIMFERMGWVLGEAGLLIALLILFLGFCMVFLTSLSISAVATNGKMKGGGAYFMVSRSLGPEFGGAIGLIFYSANVSGAALYLVGLVEALHNTFPSLPSGYWWNVLYASLALLVLTVVCFLGASAFVKANLIIFAVLVVAMLSALGSLLFERRDLSQGFTGPESATLRNNLYPQFTPVKDPYSNEEVPQDFQTIFAIFFPAMTGIMAGANMSGDLEDPAKSIPKGTMAAIFTSIGYYLFLLLALASSVKRNALLENNYILTTVCFFPPLITVGIVASTLSNALGGLIGASRVFQALAKDNLLPLIGFFAKGTAGKNEPRRAVVLTWFLAQCVVLVGNVDRLAVLATMFFLLSYAITNFACFALIVSGTPNYRPTFRYNTWYLSLTGTLLCLGAMFYVSPIYASLSVLVMLVLFFYINYRSPEAHWGHVSQAIIYHQVRKYLLRLDMTQEHVKHWRPQILFLVSNPHNHFNLVHFTNNLKKGGLYLLAHIIVGDPSLGGAYCAGYQRALYHYIKKANLKAFPEVSLSQSIRAGVQHLAVASGLGIMRPNTIVLGFPSSTNRNATTTLPEEQEEADQAPFCDFPKQALRTDDFVNVVNDVLTLERNIIVARNFERLSKDFVTGGGSIFFHSSRSKSIDLWAISYEDHEDSIEEEKQSLGWMLLMGWILSKSELWKHRSSLRVLSVVQYMSEKPLEEQRLRRLLRDTRIEARTTIVALAESRLPKYQGLIQDHHTGENGHPGHPKPDRSFASLSASDRFVIFNEAIAATSSEAGVLFAPLPLPPKPRSDSETSGRTSSEKYLSDLDLLTKDLPPILLTRGVTNVITTDL